MIKKFFAVELIIIGICMILFGLGYSIVNHDCTTYYINNSCGDDTITECVEWDTNQQIGCSLSIIGSIIIINGIVLLNDAKKGEAE